MTTNERQLADVARRQLVGLTQNFGLFPLPQVSTPEQDDWANFLREHPEYADATFKGAALVLASDRNVSEDMEESYQKLAGALVRVMFTDDQLYAIANNEYGITR